MQASKPLDTLSKVQTISEWAEGELRGKKAVICMIRPHGKYFEFQIQIFQGSFISEGVSEIGALEQTVHMFSNSDKLGKQNSRGKQNL